MDGPATPPDSVGELGLAEGGTAIQLLKKFFSGLKQIVNPLHLLKPVKVAETKSLVSYCIMIEQGFQSNTFTAPPERSQELLTNLQFLKSTSDDSIDKPPPSVFEILFSNEQLLREKTLSMINIPPPANLLEFAAIIKFCIV